MSFTLINQYIIVIQMISLDSFKYTSPSSNAACRLFLKVFADGLRTSGEGSIFQYLTVLVK